MKTPRKRSQAAAPAPVSPTLDQPSATATAVPPDAKLALDGLPMLVVDPDPPAFDVNGFDPAEFEWRPVPRRPRADGWTPEVQRAFIAALADTGMVTTAAQAVDMSVQSAYRLRHAPGSESFARAWEVAISAAADRLIDLAFARAIEGEEVPYYDRDGVRIGVKWRYDNRMMMNLLRAYRPDRFRHAHESVRQPGEPPAPALPAVAEALAALTPVPPAEPHKLMPPERLAHMVDGARAIAELDADDPRDESERFVRVRVPASHPVALERRNRRHQRERRAEQREQARYGDGDRDGGDRFLG